MYQQTTLVRVCLLLCFSGSPQAALITRPGSPIRGENEMKRTNPIAQHPSLCFGHGYPWCFYPMYDQTKNADVLGHLAHLNGRLACAIGRPGVTPSQRHNPSLSIFDSEPLLTLTLRQQQPSRVCRRRAAILKLSLRYESIRLVDFQRRLKAGFVQSGGSHRARTPRRKIPK